MNKREAKRVEREANFPSGYWPKVFAEAVRILKEKKIDGDAAYKMARNNIDEQLPQTKLFKAEL